MRYVYFDRGSGAPIAENSVEDVRLAACLLLAAASAAESELANSGVAGRVATHWAPEALTVAGALRKILKACNELERAVTGDV